MNKLNATKFNVKRLPPPQSKCLLKYKSNDILSGQFNKITLVVVSEQYGVKLQLPHFKGYR